VIATQGLRHVARSPSRNPARHPAGDGERDAGAGSVLVLALCAFLVAGCLGAGTIAQAAAARRAASTAADLGALAAADLLAVGDPTACAVAAVVVRANGSTMTSCRVSRDGSVRIGAERTVPGVLAGLGPARASARAGQPP